MSDDSSERDDGALGEALDDAPQPADSRARARVAALSEKGRAIAAYMRANPGCFQEQAALSQGVVPRTYRSWLEGSNPEHVAFQAAVLPALYEQAAAAEAKAENDVASAVGGSSAWAGWHRWKLAQRYRKIFGDLAEHRVELTGKDGGAMRHEHSLESVPTSELLATLRATRRGEDE